MQILLKSHTNVKPSFHSSANACIYKLVSALSQVVALERICSSLRRMLRFHVPRSSGTMSPCIASVEIRVPLPE